MYAQNTKGVINSNIAVLPRSKAHALNFEVYAKKHCFVQNHYTSCVCSQASTCAYNPVISFKTIEFLSFLEFIKIEHLIQILIALICGKVTDGLAEIVHCSSIYYESELGSCSLDCTCQLSWQ